MGSFDASAFNEDGRWVANSYECDCGHSWRDEWSCGCDDDCPACGLTCEASDSEDLTACHIDAFTEAGRAAWLADAGGPLGPPGGNQMVREWDGEGFVYTDPRGLPDKPAPAFPIGRAAYNEIGEGWEATPSAEARAEAEGWPQGSWGFASLAGAEAYLLALAYVVDGWR